MQNSKDYANQGAAFCRSDVSSLQTLELIIMGLIGLSHSAILQAVDASLKRLEQNVSTFSTSTDTTPQLTTSSKPTKWRKLHMDVTICSYAVYWRKLAGQTWEHAEPIQSMLQGGEEGDE